MAMGSKRLAVWIFASAFLAAGCTGGSTEKPKENAPGTPLAAPAGNEAAIVKNLAKLEPADRRLAEAQKWCAVENENLLGKMGVPFKVMVKDTPVFLCCKSCQERALADRDQTLARVEALKKEAAATTGKAQP